MPKIEENLKMELSLKVNLKMESNFMEKNIIYIMENFSKENSRIIKNIREKNLISTWI